MDGLREGVPFFVLELRLPELLGVDVGDGADQTLGELVATHFEREDGDGQFLTYADVFCNVDGERGLAHRGTARDDDQVAALQTRKLSVEIGIARRHTRDFRALLVLVKIDDLLGNFSNERGHGLEAALAARIAFVDREHDALGLIEDLRRFASFGLQRACDHVVARTDQLSQNGLVVNDFGVAADVGSGGRVVDEFRKIRKAARIGVEAGIAKRLGDGQRVGGTAALDHRGDVLVDDLVVAAVEVIGLNDVDDAV